jgi:AsmA family protein
VKLARTWHRAALGLLVGVAVLMLVWDWNWFRAPIERAVEQRTGRKFEIVGDFDVDLRWHPRVIFNQVRLANAPNGRAPHLLSADRAEIVVDLPALIGGRLRIIEALFTVPNVQLEVGAEGPNWQLAQTSPQHPDEPAAKGLPQIDRLSVDRGVLVYFDPKQQTDVRVALATQDADSSRLMARARGTLRGLSLSGSATGGSLLSLAADESPYPFEAELKIGRTRGAAKGTVSGLRSFEAAQLDVELEGETLAALHPLTGLSLPETPPYRIRGHLDHAGTRWTFKDFGGTVGDSDLSGTLTAHYENRRPRLIADLHSRQLDLDDLAGIIGATPQTGAGETASAKQRREARAADARQTVLPDRPFKLDRLRTMDADVRYSALSLRHPLLPIDALKTHLLLKDGVLKLDPLQFGIAGGRIAADVKVDARESHMALDTAVRFERLDLARLLPASSRTSAAAGTLGGHATLSGRGNSTAQWLETADGDVGLAVSGGRFSHLLVEGLGLDAAEALGLLVRGDGTVRLRCAVLDGAVQDGVVAPRAFVVDTNDTRVNVSGSIDLGDEALDLTVHPLPKDFSPLSLRSPLHIRGTFKDPKVRPDGKLLLRGGAAAALAALINPLAALLPLIETGPGKDADCESLIASVRRDATTESPS